MKYVTCHYNKNIIILSCHSWLVDPVPVYIRFRPRVSTTLKPINLKLCITNYMRHIQTRCLFWNNIVGIKKYEKKTHWNTCIYIDRVRKCKCE